MDNKRIDDVNMKVIKGLSGQKRTDFIAGLKSSGMKDPQERQCLFLKQNMVTRATPSGSNY